MASPSHTQRRLSQADQYPRNIPPVNPSNNQSTTRPQSATSARNARSNNQSSKESDAQLVEQAVNQFVNQAANRPLNQQITQSVIQSTHPAFSPSELKRRRIPSNEIHNFSLIDESSDLPINQLSTHSNTHSNRSNDDDKYRKSRFSFLSFLFPSMSRSINRPNIRSVDQRAHYQSINQSNNQTNDVSIKHTTNQSFYDRIYHKINEAVDQSIGVITSLASRSQKQPLIRSNNQPVNQYVRVSFMSSCIFVVFLLLTVLVCEIDQSINHSNRSINHSVDPSVRSSASQSNGQSNHAYTIVASFYDNGRSVNQPANQAGGRSKVTTLMQLSSLISFSTLMQLQADSRSSYQALKQWFTSFWDSQSVDQSKGQILIYTNQDNCDEFVDQSTNQAINLQCFPFPMKEKYGMSYIDVNQLINHVNTQSINDLIVYAHHDILFNPTIDQSINQLVSQLPDHNFFVTSSRLDCSIDGLIDGLMDQSINPSNLLDHIIAMSTVSQSNNQANNRPSQCKRYQNEFNIDFMIYSIKHFNRIISRSDNQLNNQTNSQSMPPFMYSDYYWQNWMINQFCDQSINQPIQQTIDQQSIHCFDISDLNQVIHQSSNQTINGIFSQSMRNMHTYNRLISQSIDQSSDKSSDHSMFGIVSKAINPSSDPLNENQPIEQIIDQAIERSGLTFDHFIKRATEQSIDQSIEQSVGYQSGTTQSMAYSLRQAKDQSNNQLVDQTINQQNMFLQALNRYATTDRWIWLISIDQSVSQSSNQSISDPAINQSANQEKKLLNWLCWAQSQSITQFILLTNQPTELSNNLFRLGYPVVVSGLAAQSAKTTSDQSINQETNQAILYALKMRFNVLYTDVDHLPVRSFSTIIQSINQSINPSIKQSIKKSIKESIQAIKQSGDKSKRSISQSITQMIKKPSILVKGDDESINQSINQGLIASISSVDAVNFWEKVIECTTAQLINQANKPAATQEGDQSLSQSTDPCYIIVFRQYQSNDQSVRQSIRQSSPDQSLDQSVAQTINLLNPLHFPATNQLFDQSINQRVGVSPLIVDVSDYYLDRMNLWLIDPSISYLNNQSHNRPEVKQFYCKVGQQSLFTVPAIDQSIAQPIDLSIDASNTQVVEINQSNKLHVIVRILTNDQSINQLRTLLNSLAAGHYQTDWSIDLHILVDRSLPQSNKQSNDQSLRQITDFIDSYAWSFGSIKRSINHSNNQKGTAYMLAYDIDPVHQSIYQSIKQSIDQSTDQTLDQSINLSLDESLDQLPYHLILTDQMTVSPYWAQSVSQFLSVYHSNGQPISRSLKQSLMGMSLAYEDSITGDHLSKRSIAQSMMDRLIKQSMQQTNNQYLWYGSQIPSQAMFLFPMFFYEYIDWYQTINQSINLPLDESTDQSNTQLKDQSSTQAIKQYRPCVHTFSTNDESEDDQPNSQSVNQLSTQKWTHWLSRWIYHRNWFLMYSIKQSTSLTNKYSLVDQSNNLLKFFTFAVTQPSNLPINQAIKQPLNRMITQNNQLITGLEFKLSEYDQSIKQLINQTIKQSIKPSVRHSTKHSKSSIDQSINQSFNEFPVYDFWGRLLDTLDQSINQLIDGSIWFVQCWSIDDWRYEKKVKINFMDDERSINQLSSLQVTSQSGDQSDLTYRSIKHSLKDRSESLAVNRFRSNEQSSDQMINQSNNQTVAGVFIDSNDRSNNQAIKGSWAAAAAEAVTESRKEMEYVHQTIDGATHKLSNNQTINQSIKLTNQTKTASKNGTSTVKSSAKKPTKPTVTKKPAKKVEQPEK